MATLRDIIRQKPWLGWVLFTGTVVIVFLLGLLASSIVERKSEALIAYTPQVEHGQYEPRNEVWGENFPRQYQSYKKTKDDSFKSKYLLFQNPFGFLTRYQIYQFCHCFFLSDQQ